MDMGGLPRTVYVLELYSGRRKEGWMDGWMLLYLTGNSFENSKLGLESITGEVGILLVFSMGGKIVVYYMNPASYLS